MTHKVVKIITDDYGEQKKNKNVWHLSILSCGDPCTLCEGEFYGMGQSNCTYKEKIVKSNGVTCIECLKHIDYFKRLNVNLHNPVKRSKK